MENQVHAHLLDSVVETHALFTSMKQSLGYGAVESLGVYASRISPISVEFNGEAHLVFLDKNQYDTKEVEVICDSVFHTIFGAGLMCLSRSRNWSRRLRQMHAPLWIEVDGEKLKVSILTATSVLMCSKIKIQNKYNTYAIMSELTYWLDTTKLFGKVRI